MQPIVSWELPSRGCSSKAESITSCEIYLPVITTGNAWVSIFLHREVRNLMCLCNGIYPMPDNKIIISVQGSITEVLLMDVSHTDCAQKHLTRHFQIKLVLQTLLHEHSLKSVHEFAPAVLIFHLFQLSVSIHIVKFIYHKQPVCTNSNLG